MKVKIIGGTNITKLENDINNFIKDKYVYDIKLVVSNGYKFVLIMYDEELKESMAVQYGNEENKNEL